ncbi:hypothetical protein [Humisphaera borealis]|uniref:Uncharacterized protein n=1 Tax=Humisphaera borealis TaxID=2807512 RepID=A0A7M2X1D2_9BACT|nr:hypothetical protein [Humisphaera borealis]QOV91262.1 hypothetical protein IPV69_07860 [Humisphaera borealis]
MGIATGEREQTGGGGSGGDVASRPEGSRPADSPGMPAAAAEGESGERATAAAFAVPVPVAVCDAPPAAEPAATPTDTPAPPASPTPVVTPVPVIAERAVSERRLAANRANALKSTGPRTPEGKARVAFNALTHGITALTVLLPDEDPQELDDIRACFDLAYAPATPVEQVLVEQLISLTWKRRRLARAEGRLCQSLAASRHAAWKLKVEVAMKLGQTAPMLPEPSRQSDIATVLVDDIHGQQDLRNLGDWERELTGQMATISRQLATWRRLRLQEQEAEDRRSRRGEPG